MKPNSMRCHAGSRGRVLLDYLILAANPLRWWGGTIASEIDGGIKDARH